MNVRDSLIKAVILGMVKRANDNHDMQEVLNEHGADGRTMSIIITDLDDGYGFAVADGKMVAEQLENPTCVVSMDKRTFSAIATNKITPAQAFFRDNIQIVGTQWLRDSIVINKIFDEIKSSMLTLSRKTK